MASLKYTKKLKPSTLSTDDIQILCEISSDWYKKKYAELEDKWEKDKLPELLKKIESHNERVEAGEKSYLFDTILTVKDKDKIVENEKFFFIHTTNHLYEWNNKVVIYFYNGKTLELSFDEFGKEQFDTKQIKSIEINTSIDETLSTNINIQDETSNYSIKGDNQDAVRSMSSKLEEFFESKRINNYTIRFREIGNQFLISIMFSIIFVITLVSVLKKVNNEIKLGLDDYSLRILVIITFIVSTFLTLRFFVSNFEYIEFGEKHRNGLSLSILSLLIASIIGNAGWELVRWIFST